MTLPEIARIVPVANSRSSNSHKADIPSMVDALQQKLGHIQIHPLIDVGVEGTHATDRVFADILDDPWLPEQKTLILLFGGDGLKTKQISKLIGMMDPMQGMESTGLLFGHVTTGEFNLDGKQYGIQPNAQAVINAVTSGNIVHIDSMRGVISGGEEFVDQSFFHSLGLFSYLVQGYEDARPRTRGKFKKLLQAASYALKEYKLGHVSVRGPGSVDLFDGMAGLVEAGKGKLIGLDLSGHSHDDNKMSVLVVPGSTMTEFVRNLLIGGFLAINHPGDNAFMRQFTGFAHVDLFVKEGTIWHFDAEMGEGTATQADIQISHDYRVPFITSGVVYRHP